MRLEEDVTRSAGGSATRIESGDGEPFLIDHATVAMAPAGAASSRPKTAATAAATAAAIAAVTNTADEPSAAAPAAATGWPRWLRMVAVALLVLGGAGVYAATRGPSHAATSDAEAIAPNTGKTTSDAGVPTAMVQGDGLFVVDATTADATTADATSGRGSQLSEKPAPAVAHPVARKPAAQASAKVRATAKRSKHKKKKKRKEKKRHDAKAEYYLD